MKISPLQVCLDGSKESAEAGTMLLCWSMANPNVRHNHMAGPSGLRLEVRMYNGWRRCGRVGRHLSGRVLIDISAAHKSEETWKESSVAGIRPSYLCRTLTPDIVLEMVILSASVVPLNKVEVEWKAHMSTGEIRFPMGCHNSANPACERYNDFPVLLFMHGRRTA